MLKKPFRSLLGKYKLSSDKTEGLKRDLDSAQANIDKDPVNADFRIHHANILKAYNQLVDDEEKLLAQRCKINWLSDGDRDSRFFHKILKSNQNKSRIVTVMDEEGRWIHGREVANKFVDHFSNFLGQNYPTERLNQESGFFRNVLDQDSVVDMIKVVRDEEIKLAMVDIDDIRAPGPDEFSSKFYKAAWNVIRNDICRETGSPRFSLKIDLQKAYDTVSWDFLKQTLIGFKFHPFMIQWIMECVSTPSFTLKNIHNMDGFRFHSRCKDLNITHLCFANDLLASVFKFPVWVNKEIEKIIRGFLWCSGEMKQGKAKVSWEQFCKSKKEGGLGIKSLKQWNISHLTKHVWNILVKKDSLWVKWIHLHHIKGRNVWDILSKPNLSWGWRRFLEIREDLRPFITSCIGKGNETSIWHDRWHPISPISSILSRRKRISKGFHDDSKVAELFVNGAIVWPGECLKQWNISHLTKHVWNILVKKDSLWVKWIHLHHIKGRNVWDILSKPNLSWGWRRFLEIREDLRPFITSCIGKGNETSIWHDRWHPISPISSILSRRQRISKGFHDDSKVAELFVNDAIVWPGEWLDIFPNLSMDPICMLNNQENNKYFWVNLKGAVGKFSTKQVWRDLYGPEIGVPWYDTILFKDNIHRNAFILWMAMLGKLKTQDRVRNWEKMGNLECAFCVRDGGRRSRLFCTEEGFDVIAFLVEKIQLGGEVTFFPILNKLLECC
ncbi:unnamed protein product [Lactuca virosa]|uniref:Reverse transcriptase zinc-binding domain-containing protein n=1 Tax=Lactuca virosa TaxID=75947 RepID=A0AAU9PLB0_9ASTR|nr:unnamed protein product [Lactuca virosa]